ncbi:MAG: glycosyltransferase [archaeon]|jgi:1,2-diacylglycerol-3-alpha-glucose alpha-1,2-galactosyltransferase
MKVLFVVNENPDSGISVYANNVGKELNKKISVSVDKKLNESYDLIHVHSCRPDNLLRIKSMHPTTPIVATTHMTSGEVSGLVPDFLLNFIDFGLISFYRSCDRIFVTSPHIFRMLRKDIFLKDKLVVLPNPIDFSKFKGVNKSKITEFKKKQGFGIKRKVVLCVGSIQYRKGIFDFAAAAKKLPQYDFVWVGKMPDIPSLKRKDEIRELIENKKSSNLYFTGPLYENDLALAYYSSDLFWLPSFSETFGLVIVEAAACKKLILMRDLPVKEMFSEFIVSYTKNPEEKIVQMLEHPNKFSHLKSAMKKSILRFKLEKHALELINDYEEILDKAHKKNRKVSVIEELGLRKQKGVLVSIIVPTLNEKKHIIQTLKALNKQTVPRKYYEIIVSDSSSTDNTVKLAKKLADKVVVCKRQGAGYGRNFGEKFAKGKYLGFVDADTIVEPTWVEGLIEGLNTGVACTGPLENIEKDSLKINAFYKWWNIQSKASVIVKYPIFPGFNFGARKKEFRQAGGFPNINMVCEDMDLSLRLGSIGKVAFSKKMAVRTSARRQKEIPLHKHALSGIRYALTKRSMSWNEYRKDY